MISAELIIKTNLQSLTKNSAMSVFDNRFGLQTVGPAEDDVGSSDRRFVALDENCFIAFFVCGEPTFSKMIGTVYDDL